MGVSGPNLLGGGSRERGRPAFSATIRLGRPLRPESDVIYRLAGCRFSRRCRVAGMRDRGLSSGSYRFLLGPGFVLLSPLGFFEVAYALFSDGDAPCLQGADHLLEERTRPAPRCAGFGWKERVLRGGIEIGGVCPRPSRRAR